MSKKVAKIDDQEAGNKNTRSTKWLLTVNNPLLNNLDRDTLIRKCEELNPIYYCMSDEIGLNGQTYHTHIYIVFKNARFFNTLKKCFPASHIDQSFGTHDQNRDYVFKEGKWLEDEKGETNLRDTHYEQGEIPVTMQGQRTDLFLVKKAIDEGKSASEIIDMFPDYLFNYDKIAKLVEQKRSEAFEDVERNIISTYIVGKTRSGKTYYVTHKYGHKNVFRVTNYKNPFDRYKGEDVIIFDEFHGQLNIDEMLDLLDPYPTELKGRYFDHTACYTKVYVISNKRIENQFKQAQISDHETYEAFIARFKCFMDFRSRTERIVYNDYNDYLLDMGCSLEEYEAEHPEMELVVKQETSKEESEEAEIYEQIKLEG